MHKITTLDNGLRVVTEEMNDCHSAAVNLWVKTGSRYEKEENNGISHFLEHMAFKGTEKRSAKAIAEEFDAIGGYLNAYTSKEYTVYTTKALKEDTELSIDIISDILQNSVFEQEEIEKERNVILQEIAQTNDTPDDIIFDYFQEEAFNNQALGRPILGREEVVKRLNKEDFLSYLQNYYHGKNMVLSACGNIEHDRIVELASKYFTELSVKDLCEPEKAIYTGGERYVERDLEQVHFILGFQGVPYHSDEAYLMYLASAILGGSMSSRLFQEVREKRGLAYSIYSMYSNFNDTGVFSVYAGTSAKDANEMIDVVCDELHNLYQNIEENEIERAKAQVRASILMSYESSSFRAEELGRQFTIYGRKLNLEEIMGKLNRLTKNDIKQFVNNKLLKSLPTVAVIGKIDNIYNYDDIKRKLKI